VTGARVLAYFSQNPCIQQENSSNISFICIGLRFFQEALIHAVIKLPEGILFPHNQSYSILVLKMGRDKAEKIRFIDASTTSRQLANRKGLWLEDIVRIMNLMEKPSTKDLYVARAIEPKKILESSEVDLTVPQYISQPSESMDITQQDLLTQITSLEEMIILLNEKLNNLSDKL
jgi:type I restriction-modification system DNA methylase subunit